MLNPDDESFVERVRRGDSEAIEEIYRVGRSTASRWERNVSDREEIVQETALKVIVRVRRGDCDDWSILGLTRKIATVSCINAYKKKQKINEVELTSESDAGPVLSAGLESALINEQLVGLIKFRLPAHCSEILTLVFTQGLSSKQIAHLQGRKEATVRKRYSRCLKTARQIFGQLEPEGIKLRLEASQ